MAFKAAVRAVRARVGRWADAVRVGPDSTRELGRHLGARC